MNCFFKKFPLGMTLLLFAFILSDAKAYSQPSLTPEEKDRNLYNAFEEYKNKNYTKSLNLLNSTLQSDSSYFKAYYLKGAIMMEQNQVDAAIENYSEIFKYIENFEHVYYNLGLCYGDKRNYKEAIKCFDKEISYYPSQPFGYFYKGYYTARSDIYNIEKNQEAISYYQKALQLDSLNADFLYQMSISQKHAKNSIGAIRTLDKAIRIRPARFEYYDERNTCHFLANTPYRKRKADLYEGVDQFKNNPNEKEPGMQYLYISKCFVLMHDFSKNKPELDSAFLYINKAIAADSKNYKFIYERGSIYMHSLSNYPEAIKDFRIALELNPYYLESHLNYAWSLKHSGKNEEAYKAFKEGEKYFPNDFRIKEGLKYLNQK